MRAGCAGGAAARAAARDAAALGHRRGGVHRLRHNLLDLRHGAEEFCGVRCGQRGTTFAAAATHEATPNGFGGDRGPARPFLEAANKRMNQLNSNENDVDRHENVELTRRNVDVDQARRRRHTPRTSATDRDSISSSRPARDAGKAPAQCRAPEFIRSFKNSIPSLPAGCRIVQGLLFCIVMAKRNHINNTPFTLHVNVRALYLQHVLMTL